MNILNVSSNFDVENYVSISSHSGARYPFMQLKVPSKILHESWDIELQNYILSII